MSDPVQTDVTRSAEAPFVADGVVLGRMRARAHRGLGGTRTHYVYVMEVTPAIEGVTGFQTDFPAGGFTGRAGYAGVLLRSGVPRTGRVIVGCDGGKLTWAVEPAAAWNSDERMIFFWESYRPPAAEPGAAALTVRDRTATAPVPRAVPAPGKAAAGERCR